MLRFLPLIFVLGVVFYDIFILPYFTMWSILMTEWTMGSILLAIITVVLTFWANGLALWLAFIGAIFNAFTRRRVAHPRSNSKRA